MTDNTQELDDILSEFGWRAIRKPLGIAGLNIEQKEAKQAILAWHNKQILESLDRLLVEVKQAYDKEGDFLEMAVDTIEAERNKLEAEL